MIGYKNITTDRQFRDATGMSKADFGMMLSDYEVFYLSEHGMSYETYVVEGIYDSDSVALKTLGECLFLVFFQQKNDLVFGSLGFVFGMSPSTAYDYFERFSKLLRQMLEEKKDAQTQFSRCRDIQGMYPRHGGTDI